MTSFAIPAEVINPAELPALQELATVLDAVSHGVIVVADFEPFMKLEDGTWISPHGRPMTSLEVADQHGPYDIPMTSAREVVDLIDWTNSDQWSAFTEEALFAEPQER